MTGEHPLEIDARRTISLSSRKHWRAVNTPASSSAVSIEEISLRQRRSPVG
jgi:hypothetical protein